MIIITCCGVFRKDLNGISAFPLSELIDIEKELSRLDKERARVEGEIAREIVRCGGFEGRVHIALDYFDASINRISAWATGFRSVQKALLFALLQPHETLKKLQDEGDFTRLMVLREELGTLPFGEIWNEYCTMCSKPVDGEWYSEIKCYEKRILEARA